MRTGPAFPRTRKNPMFPQFPGHGYEDPPISVKMADIIVVASIFAVGWIFFALLRVFIFGW